MAAVDDQGRRHRDGLQYLEGVAFGGRQVLLLPKPRLSVHVRPEAGYGDDASGLAAPIFPQLLRVQPYAEIDVLGPSKLSGLPARPVEVARRYPAGLEPPLVGGAKGQKAGGVVTVERLKEAERAIHAVRPFSRERMCPAWRILKGTPSAIRYHRTRWAWSMPKLWPMAASCL